MLTSDGPLQVLQLGPVDLVHVRLDNGATPHGLVCEASPGEVAYIADGRVVARGTGRAEVSCTWEDQQVQFDLEVLVATKLSFQLIPNSVRVGELAELEVHALQGEETVPLGPSRWESSDVGVLHVVPGQVQGRAPGVAFVTVRARGATAQAQIRVAP